MHKKKILVTGAAGFLGSHVCDALLDKDYSVTGVDDLSGGFLQNLDPRIDFVSCDIANNDSMQKLWNEKGPFHIVYHLAAYAAEGLSHFIRRFNYNNNLIGSINLINEAVKSEVCECFVFTSSIAAYGEQEPPLLETTIPVPADPYGIAKYAVELDLKSAHEMWGLNSIIFRPHNVYGERQNIMDPYRNVVGIFMRCAIEGKPFPIFGDGLQSRAFSYIGDLAPVIVESALRTDCFNETFNIGSDDVSTVIELAEIISDEFNVPLNINWLEERVEAKHAYSDHSKLHNFFPYAGSTSLEKGIAMMSKWVKETGVWEASHPENVEVEKNLPDSWRKIILGN
jgi:UDP-glucose 4-epimerase